MDELVVGDVAQPGGQVMNSARRSAPWREIALAVLIVVFGVVVSLLFRATANAAFRIMGWGAAQASPTIGLLLFTLPDEIFCILAVIARARQLNGNDYYRGLAAGPIRRSRLFVVLIALHIVAIVWYGAYELASPEYAHSLPREWHGPLIAAATEGPFLLIGYLFQNIILAPVAEELMFRGWLWTELSRRWGAWPTGLITSFFWLMLHFGYGVNGVLHLWPAAVALSLARHYTGSVRATIALHCMSNARTVILNVLPFFIK
jgi:membrane protease YdiL (CAAX protease family)